MVNIVIFSPLDQIQKVTPLTKLTFPFLGAKLLYNWLCLSVYLSVVLSVVCSSVFTPLAVLYMAIVYIVYNDSLLFLETNPPPLPILDRLLLSVFSLNSSVNCLNTTDKIFAPMDDGRLCSYLTIFRTCIRGGGLKPVYITWLRLCLTIDGILLFILRSLWRGLCIDYLNKENQSYQIFWILSNSFPW